jgi:hypothetical protein
VASIPIADVLDIERLPIDAQDVITRVRLVIAGTHAGREPHESHAVATDDHPDPEVGFVRYFADPVVFEYEAPEHATYGCTRSLALPEGFNPFLPPDSELIADPIGANMADPAAVRDGDPTTFATPTQAGGSLEYESSPLYVGVKVRFKADVAPDRLEIIVTSGKAARFEGDTSTPVQVWGRYALEAQEMDDWYLILPPDARNRSVNTPGALNSTPFGASLLTPAEGSIEIYEFWPLALNEALLLDVAKANVRLPASNPQRITVRGYVAPDRSHTIVGWPGGDYTASVAQHQYDLGRTVIDFEQAGAPVGLPAEAIESARERKAAIDREVATASYSLRMGERQ